MMSSSMWNPYQSNKQSTSIYTTPISPLNSSTGSETSASSLNSSEHEKLNSNNRNNLNQNLQQTSLSVSSFIPTPDYDNEEQQHRESSPNAVNNNDYISHHNTQMQHNSNMTHHHHQQQQQQQQQNSFHQTPVINIQDCGRASTDSESVSNSSDASSSPDSTGSPTYRSPSNSFTGYSSSATTNVTGNQMHQTYNNNNHFSHQQSFNTQPSYNYFGDFQNSYYSSGQIPIKQELKQETFLNDYSKLNNFSTNHHQYSMNNTTAFGTNSLEKQSDESSKSSSSSPPTTPILPLANMTNNIATAAAVATSPFNMHHPHNPYAVHAAAAVNNYYNSMNLNPYAHYHHHHHPPYLNHNYNTAQFNNSYSNNRDFNSTNTFLNSSVTTPTSVSTAPSRPAVKVENNLPTSNINRSTNNNNNNNSNISTISDSNITNSYETSPGLLPYLQVNLKGNLTSNPNIKAKLQDQSLWKQFNQIGTEMIITKCGRRMFPSLRVSVSGLDSNSKYTMLIEIVPVDDNRYKYHNGEWIISGKAEAHFVGRGYLHPDSPLSGNQWMKQIISFHKLKLTNNPFDRSGHIILNSMHKYVPRLHIIEEGKSLTTFVFNEAIFTAVTAYQNEMITKLKIEYNPFAKGFRDGQNRKDYRNKRNSDDENENIDERNFIPSMNNHMKTMKYNDENYENMKLNYVR